MARAIGWIVSALLVLCVAGVVLYYIYGGKIPPETAAVNSPGALDKLELGIDPRENIEIPEGTPGAAASYSEALKELLLLGRPQDVRDMLAGVAEPEKDRNFKPILEKIKAGGTLALENSELIFEDISPSPIAPNPADVALQTLCNVANKAGMSYAADKNKEQAKKCLNAGFLLGYRLWTNGVYQPYRTAGINGMYDASLTFCKIWGPKHFNNEENLKVWDTLAHNIQPLRSKWNAKANMYHQATKVNLGDVAFIADKDPDRTWRIDALYWMGVCQWTSADSLQRQAVQRFLSAHAGDSDPLVAKAAKEAAAISRIDVRQMSLE